MANKDYFVVFGTGNPTTNTGLACTFTMFKNASGVSTTFPAISEISGTGVYTFAYGPTNAIAFVVDGLTAGLGANRYVVGSLDPVDAVDQYIGLTLYPMGVSTLNWFSGASFLGASLNAISGAIGASGSIADLSARIGTTASSFGSTSVDPGTLFGYVKRLQEFNEGNSVFTKSTSVWDIYSRGSSTLLVEKTLDDSSGNVTKT